MHASPVAASPRWTPARTAAVLIAALLASVAPRARAQEAPGAKPPPAAGPSAPKAVPLLSRWNVELSGFVELDAIHDSTESFADLAGNGTIARDRTFAGTHSRTMMGLRNSRLALAVSSPDGGGLRASGLVELDFRGNQPPNVSESDFFTSPGLRLRHAYLKLETPSGSVLAGQTWRLFGWQPYFHPSTAEIQGIPGQIYVRTPQIRVSWVFQTPLVNLEVAAAILRPIQRDSGIPDGETGLRLIFGGRRGLHTAGASSTRVDSLAVGVSGLLRGFRLQGAAEDPASEATATGWGYSVDLLIPVIPATLTERANGLTLTGSLARGDGIADQYTGLSGGFASPNAFGGASPTVDPGLIVQDAGGGLHAVQWRSFILGAQYYLPGSAAVWMAVNYSQMDSFNAVALAGAANASKVFQQSRWVDANLFCDVIPAVRLGLEYARFEQTYADGQKASNDRWQLSAIYLF